MGPAAGVDLLGKITRFTHAGVDQDHLPVLLFSVPNDIPDRTRFLLSGEGRNPGEPIADLALRLEDAGATVAGIPCNTAHAPVIIDCVTRRLDRVQSKLSLINMIDETVGYVRTATKPGSLIGVLSTTGTRLTRIYSDPLILAGFDVVELDETSHEELVMDALYSRSRGIKAVSPPWTGARDRLLRAIEILVSQGADVVILGCTELPLAVPEPRWRGIPLIDPAGILARALIRATYPDRLAPDQS
jgi:aspartate racemase